MISRELSMRLSAGLLPGRVNDRLVSGGSDLKFWLAQPRCPGIRETPPRCSHCCSMNSSLRLWLLLLEQAGLKEFCVQQALPDCGLHATFYSPLWYVQLDGCILTSLLETMGQLGHINDSFQKSMFSKLNLEIYGFRWVKQFQVLFAFSAQPAISEFISGRISE